MHQKESASEFRRRRAIELIQQGETISTIARMLDVTRASIYNWCKRYKLGGEFKAAPRSGRPRKLSNDQLNTLSELLMQGATAHGWPNDLWTAKRVAEIIRRSFGVKFCIPHVRNILKYYMGWSVQRPIQQEKERNEAEIQLWKEQIFPQIVRDARTKGAHIVFIDEAGFMTTPTFRQTYAPRGKTPVIQVTDAHGRISVAGAITISPINRNLGFVYHLLPDNLNFHGNAIVQFLKEIYRRIRGPIILLWDSFSIHLSQPVIQYITQHPRITYDQLPAYAHELNPVDKGWLYIKYDCLPNFAPTTLDELRDRLIEEFDALRKKPKVIAWCIEQAGLKTRVE